MWLPIVPMPRKPMRCLAALPLIVARMSVGGNFVVLLLAGSLFWLVGRDCRVGDYYCLGLGFMRLILYRTLCRLI